MPDAEDALVVNNGAAALVLATTALAAGREVVVSRGELVEIGDGFRLPDLIASTGARLREVGTTNRTHLRDYADAIGPETGCVLKVHPSNFRVEGFTARGQRWRARDGCRPAAARRRHRQRAAASRPAAARRAGRHDRAAPTGADVVTCSGDKLLGGPQAGLVLGRRRRRRAAAPAPAGPGAAGRQAHPGRPRGDRCAAPRRRPSPRSRSARPR